MRTKIIAEVSSNHAGNIFIAKRFVRVAAQGGADYVKFQSYRYEDLADKNDPQAWWIKKTSLSDAAHIMLIREAKKMNMRFLTTCFSLSRIEFLSSLGLEEIKVSSPDLLSFNMIEKLSRYFKHIIISTGMHSIGKIKKAVKFILQNKINATLMHAVSLYPVPIEKSFMHRFIWLKDHFPRVGYSHHSADLACVLFAIAHEAEIVEVHIKLGEKGPGRVTFWDIGPSGLRYITSFRDEVSVMCGEKKWLKSNDFLFLDEKRSGKRFIGRWGINK